MVLRCRFKIIQSTFIRSVSFGHRMFSEVWKKKEQLVLKRVAW